MKLICSQLYLSCMTIEIVQFNREKLNLNTTRPIGGPEWREKMFIFRQRWDFPLRNLLRTTIVFRKNTLARREKDEQYVNV